MIVCVVTWWVDKIKQWMKETQFNLKPCRKKWWSRIKRKSQMILLYVCVKGKQVKWWFMHELYNISVYFHWISSSRRCHGFRFWNPLVFLSTFFLTFGRSLFLPSFFFSAIIVRCWDISVFTFSSGPRKKIPELKFDSWMNHCFNVQDLVTASSVGFVSYFVPTEADECEIFFCFVFD